MRIIVKLLLGVLIVAVLIGAYAAWDRGDPSDLETGQITAASPEYPSTAIPYSLAEKTFVLATTTAVTGCVQTLSGEEISGTTKLAIDERVGVDPSQQYYIYFESGSRSKNLDYSVEAYDNGTLKSLSASIKDQVAPIAAGATGSLVPLFTSPLAAMATAGPAPPASSNCQELNAALKEHPDDPRLVVEEEDLWTPQVPASLSYTVDASLAGLARNFKLGNPRWVVPNAIVELRLPQDLRASPRRSRSPPGPAPRVPPHARRGRRPW